MGITKKILIIDDDADIRESIKVILESNGFEAYSAQDAKEGIAAVENYEPDVVLCDMMMEELDSGTKVAKAIKKTTPKTPIYLLSSIGDATAANIEVDELGFKGVFQKPVEPEQMISTIRQELGL